MPHIVLGDTAVEVSVDTRLNGNAQSGGGAAADVAPSLPIVGAALPLVSYPIAAGCHSKGGGAAHGAVVVFRLGGDDHRRLLGQGSKLSPVLPAQCPPIAVIVAGGVVNGIIGNGFPVIGGQKVLPLRIPVGIGVGGFSIGSGQNIAYRVIDLGCRWDKYTTDLQCWQHPIILLIWEMPWNPKIPGLMWRKPNLHSVARSPKLFRFHTVNDGICCSF